MLALPIALASTAVGQSLQSEDAMAPAFWTGTWTETGFEPGTENRATGYTDLVDPIARGRVSADDPRIAGTWTQVSHLYFTDSPDPDDGEVAIASGVARIDNDAGAWVGTVIGYSGAPDALALYVMEGEGAYEGLTAVFRWVADDSSYEGVILPTGVPPLPDWTPPPAE
jgi:hypothetical protein